VCTRARACACARICVHVCVHVCVCVRARARVCVCHHSSMVMDSKQCSYTFTPAFSFMACTWTALTFSILLCTFGRVANIFEFFQCVLLVEVKVSTLKVHFVSLSAHCGNAENTFQHL